MLKAIERDYKTIDCSIVETDVITGDTIHYLSVVSLANKFETESVEYDEARDRDDWFFPGYASFVEIMAVVRRFKLQWITKYFNNIHRRVIKKLDLSEQLVWETKRKKYTRKCKNYTYRISSRTVE